MHSEFESYYFLKISMSRMSCSLPNRFFLLFLRMIKPITTANSRTPRIDPMTINAIFHPARVSINNFFNKNKFKT